MKRTLLAARNGYIDPKTCDSTVGFRVTKYKYSHKKGAKWNYSADVSLSDCNRKIEWNITVDAFGLTKLDNAIEILQDARDAIVNAMGKK